MRINFHKSLVGCATIVPFRLHNFRNFKERQDKKNGLGTDSSKPFSSIKGDIAVNKTSMSTMHPLYLLFVFVLVSASPTKSESIIYVSPGIGFAWSLDGAFIFHAKVSVGVFNSGIFYNITLGSASSADKSAYPHLYAEAQSGILLPPSMDGHTTHLFYGGGVGITFPAGKTENVSWRFSAFAGSLLFLNVNVLLLDTPRTDIGGEIVLPIPINGVKFGSVGG